MFITSVDNSFLRERSVRDNRERTVFAFEPVISAISRLVKPATAESSTIRLSSLGRRKISSAISVLSSVFPSADAVSGISSSAATGFNAESELLQIFERILKNHERNDSVFFRLGSRRHAFRHAS